MPPTISLRDVLLGQPSGSGSGAGGPLVEAERLLKRVTKRDDNPDPSNGVLDPHDINNVGFFFLFALIGVAFVLTGIWFFFWAKNGGFHFRDDDWDDYKSTVLRRKGPNGTILSNITKSTKLGGGSIYKEYDEDGSQTVITESTGLSGITAGPSDIYARERREEKRRKKEAERKKRRGGDSDKKKNKKQGNEGVLDETAEKEAREQLRNYRHERAARVGGLNKETEGSDWDGSTNHAESTVSSGLLSSHNKEAEAAAASSAASAAPPSSKAPRSGGIRKVYSVADRTTARENEKMRAEARKLREEARRAKRDSNYERALLAPSDEQLNQSLLSGSGQGGESSLGSSMLSEESGAKSYHHPLPELKEYRRREREERRARRGGYLRGNTRDEELEEEVD